MKDDVTFYWVRQIVIWYFIVREWYRYGIFVLFTTDHSDNWMKMQQVKAVRMLNINRSQFWNKVTKIISRFGTMLKWRRWS